jgi:hypothetical protein
MSPVLPGVVDAGAALAGAALAGAALAPDAALGATLGTGVGEAAVEQADATSMTVAVSARTRVNGVLIELLLGDWLI